MKNHADAIIFHTAVLCRRRHKAAMIAERNLKIQLAIPLTQSVCGMEISMLQERSNLTTLCYIEHDDKYLMLHRVKRENDINKDKWIGVGGHFEKDESPEECLLREVKEETGLTLKSWSLRGVITFICNKCRTEYMFLYTADEFEGTLRECDEGVLEWVDKSGVSELPIWEGDKLFFRLLEQSREFFSLKLVYEDDRLVDAKLNGADIKENAGKDENGGKAG